MHRINNIKFISSCLSVRLSVRTFTKYRRENPDLVKIEKHPCTLREDPGTFILLSIEWGKKSLIRVRILGAFALSREMRLLVSS